MGVNALGIESRDWILERGKLIRGKLMDDFVT